MRECELPNPVLESLSNINLLFGNVKHDNYIILVPRRVYLSIACYYSLRQIMNFPRRCSIVVTFSRIFHVVIKTSSVG